MWGHYTAPGCWRSGSSLLFNSALQTLSTADNSSAHICKGTELKEVSAPTAEFHWESSKDKQCAEPLTEQECRDEAFKRKMTFSRAAFWGHYTAPGCWRSGSSLLFNTAKQHQSNQGNARGHLCNGKDVNPLSEPDGFWITSGNQVCEHPVNSKEECIKAAFDHKFGFSRAANWGNGYPKGCWRSGTTLFFNTATSSSKNPSTRYPMYCFREPATDAPTSAPTMAPTDAPTMAPTDSWEGEAECNPENCKEWNCNTWCSCFSKDSLLVEVFEGEDPTESDLYVRQMCASDDDDCQCNE
jgi:hypothetical protein